MMTHNIRFDGEIKKYPFFYHHLSHWQYHPRREKTGLRGFRPGLTLTRLYNGIKWLEA